MNEITISLPFSIDAYGKVSTTSDQKKIWADRVRSVIGTNLRERLMRPDFGSLVPATFMETQESANATIASEVERAFSNQLPGLTLQSVDNDYEESSGVMKVSLLYSLPNNEQIDTTISLVYIENNQPVYEVNL